jgi:hypothetical protein
VSPAVVSADPCAWRAAWAEGGIRHLLEYDGHYFIHHILEKHADDEFIDEDGKHLIYAIHGKPPPPPDDGIVCSQRLTLRGGGLPCRMSRLNTMDATEPNHIHHMLEPFVSLNPSYPNHASGCD